MDPFDIIVACVNGAGFDFVFVVMVFLEFNAAQRGSTTSSIKIMNLWRTQKLQKNSGYSTIKWLKKGK